jgi:hypothetical protein
MNLATRQLTFRLPEVLITRVEDCVTTIQEQSGMKVTRADVVRLLLTRALDLTHCDLRALFATPPATKPDRRRGRRQ